MSRYEYDIRRPMRRRDDTPSGWGVILVIGMILAMFATIAGIVAAQTNDRAAVPASVAKARTDNGGTIRVYSVQVDGVEYLLSERGGICRKEV